MKVRWSETALVEIEGIFSYIYENNRSAATSVERIEARRHCLKEFPLIGHLSDEADVRALPVVRSAHAQRDASGRFDLSLMAALTPGRTDRLWSAGTQVQE